jgi:hypothetical protein
MKRLFLLLTISAFFYACDSEQAEKERLKKEAIADSLARIEKLRADSIAKADSISRAENLKKLEGLKKKFIFEKDEFRNIDWYYHKNWGKHWLNRKGLTASVNSFGDIYLKSNYHATDWLFHTQIQVKIEDEVLESSIAETYSNNHLTEVRGGSIWEANYYTNGRDKRILRKIAENAEKRIKVRFIGSPYYYDITLSKIDKYAIKDCYELAQLLQTTNK